MVSDANVVDRGDNIDGATSRPVSAARVRRARVPFDSRPATADDRSLHDRAAELRAKYKAMQADGMDAGALAVMSEEDASVVCVVS